jgi:CheY-like chemotaxis protein
MSVDSDSLPVPGNSQGTSTGNEAPPPANLTATPAGTGPVAHSHELIGRLASGIVHDFNKVLTVMLGNLSLLQASLAADNSQRSLLAALDNAANQAADLTRQLLALARHETPRAEPVDLNAVTEQVASLLRHTIDPRIELVVQPRAGLRGVLADRGRMTRVVLNLCLNACDAMPQGGRLRLATDEVLVEPTAAPRGPGLHARLTVEDTGQGMPEEVQAHIFEPSFTTKQPGAGTGLGLAIVAGLVRESGGWIECNSAPGRGTRFDIYLPLLEYAPGSASAGGATILVVESEPQVRELARTILEKEGYRVAVAADSRQAVEVLRQAKGKMALVLLDLHSAPAPVDTLAELHAFDPAVRVVVVDGQQAAAAIPAGVANVQGILTKPFRPADLLAAVRAAMAASEGQGGTEAGEQGAAAGQNEEVTPPA